MYTSPEGLTDTSLALRSISGPYSKNQKRYFVLKLKLQCVLHMYYYYTKVQMLLHKTTEGNRNNYTKLATDKTMCTHNTHTN